ncbi:hypothetical protein AB5J62_33775 [Amycolatopsis sp. cg5]|uniref:hypothetical protein n=1 Tax=Amycolatopsis sp. cg5 TaxID=3238802 RepID=UPI003523813B
MTAPVESLDIAEMRDQHDPDTPLFNELMAEYDADVIDELCQGWPPVMTVPDDEPGENPDQDTEPGEVEPGETPGDASEPVPDPTPTPAE